MADSNERTTWDGEPIASSPPYGATIVLYRQAEHNTEILVLHRAIKGKDFDGDWAWTPPSGSRYPGELIMDCARRELLEETGLSIDLVPIEQENTEWKLFAGKVSAETSIALSEEHDSYQWVTVDRAMEICKPRVVASGIAAAASALGLSPTSGE